MPDLFTFLAFPASGKAVLFSTLADEVSPLEFANPAHKAAWITYLGVSGLPDTGATTITTLGTVTTGTWHGGVIAGQYGGTGVANTGKTLTLGGNLVTSGAYACTLTLTGATTVTMPTTGTLATTAATDALATAIAAKADETDLTFLAGTVTGKEDSLGVPGDNGFILVSQLDGTRSWVSPAAIGTVNALAYANPRTVNLGDYSYQPITLTGDITFASGALQPGQTTALLLTASGADRALAFPAGWTFLGAAAPTSLASGKQAVLSLTSFGTTDAEVIAAYAAQP